MRDLGIGFASPCLDEGDSLLPRLSCTKAHNEGLKDVPSDQALGESSVAVAFAAMAGEPIDGVAAAGVIPICG